MTNIQAIIATKHQTNYLLYTWRARGYVLYSIGSIGQIIQQSIEK